MADSSLGEFYGTTSGGEGGAQGWVHLAGAALSAALLVGVVVWGYQLLMRDVTGIPVIEALDGPMRVQPEEPGGEQMAYQGLSVNEVAAAGEAGDIADELQLAPEAPELLDHDLPPGQLSPQPLPDLSSATDAAVADVLEELAGVGGEAGEGKDTLAAGPDEEAGRPAATGPGLHRSLRPPPRPARLVQAAAPGGAEAVPAPAVAALADAVEIDADTLPVGARLVQLGAFESPEAARAEWATIATRFADVMKGKKRVIQQASTNGLSFYRLRVAGFEDLADARRFCATLTADPSRPLCVPAALR